MIPYKNKIIFPRKLKHTKRARKCFNTQFSSKGRCWLPVPVRNYMHRVGYLAKLDFQTCSGAGKELLFQSVIGSITMLCTSHLMPCSVAPTSRKRWTFVFAVFGKYSAGSPHLCLLPSSRAHLRPIRCTAGSPFAFASSSALPACCNKSILKGYDKLTNYVKSLWAPNREHLKAEAINDESRCCLCRVDHLQPSDRLAPIRIAASVTCASPCPTKLYMMASSSGSLSSPSPAKPPCMNKA